jgi:hypothetical protein
LILLRKRAHDRQQSPLPLDFRQLFFRIRGRVEMNFHEAAVGIHPHLLPSFPVPILQGEVVRYSKNPAAKIRARPPQLQMSEQRKKNFLNDVLAIVRANAQGEDVAKEAVAQLIEEKHHLFFDGDSRYSGRKRRIRGTWIRQLNRRVSHQDRHFFLSDCAAILQLFALILPAATDIRISENKG